MTDTFETLVRVRLQETFADAPSATANWDAIHTRGRAVERRRRRHLVTALAGLAIVMAIASAAVGVTAFRTRSPQRVVAGPGPAPSTRLRLVSTTDIGPNTQADGLVATADGAWVSAWGGAQVIHVGADGSVEARLPVGSTQEGPLAIAEGAGSIWVLDFKNSELVRVDEARTAAGRAVVTGRTHLAGEPERLAFAGGRVWVTVCCDRSIAGRAGNQRLQRIDPVSLRVVGETALPGDGESEQVRAGPHGLFVAGEDFDTILQIDPATGHLAADHPVGPNCDLVVGPEPWCIFGPMGAHRMVGLDDRGTVRTVSTPYAVQAAGFVGDHLLAAMSDELYASTVRIYELDGSTWRYLATQPAFSLMAGAGSRLWAVSGNRLLQYQVGP